MCSIFFFLFVRYCGCVRKVLRVRQTPSQDQELSVRVLLMQGTERSLLWLVPVASAWLTLELVTGLLKLSTRVSEQEGDPTWLFM